MKHYRKRPVVIEAIQWDGSNEPELIEFVGDSLKPAVHPDYLEIHTLEGVMTADLGDWIIKGVKGEFYPCKPEIFEATYEEVLTETSDSPN